jgi:glutamine synthetase
MVGNTPARRFTVASPSAPLTLERLTEFVGNGDIDTVIVAFTDMQGRLVGKRVSARLFLEDVAEHGAECR